MNRTPLIFPNDTVPHKQTDMSARIARARLRLVNDNAAPAEIEAKPAPSTTPLSDAFDALSKACWRVFRAIFVLLVVAFLGVWLFGALKAGPSEGGFAMMIIAITVLAWGKLTGR